jgi:hypothetical protein
MLEPTFAEVLEAKEMILALLSDGEVHRQDELINVLNDSRGLLRDASAYTLNTQAWDSRDDAIARIRQQHAGITAVMELEMSGALVRTLLNPERIFTEAPGIKSSVDVPAKQPAVGDSYRLRPHASELGLERVLDRDLFARDSFADLRLGPRTQLTLDEALAAFRRQLWLACASLMGAVSEAAWFGAGERLRGRDSSLDKALDRGDSVTQVVTRACRLIDAARGRWPNAAAELQSHAFYLWRIRNYGVHPRDNVSDADLEEAFTEAGCAVLLLRTRSYLTLLSDAVDAVTA